MKRIRVNSPTSSSVLRDRVIVIFLSALDSRNFEKPVARARNSLESKVFKIVAKTVFFSFCLQVSPGEAISLNIQGYDELNHTIFTIATLTEKGVSDITPKLGLDNTMHLLSPVTNQSFPFMYRLANETLYKEIKNNTVHHFQLEDVFSTLKNRYSFKVTAIPCRPGFKFENTKCICDKKIEGVLR